MSEQKWERLSDHMDLWRTEVPGGWLYKTLGEAVFVPRPAESDAAILSALLNAEEVLREIESKRLLGDLPIDNPYRIAFALDMITKALR